MANLYYQLDCIWNQLKHKLLGIPIRNFLKQIFETGKPKSRLLLLMATHLKKKKHGSRKLCFVPTCPHSCWKGNLSCCWGIHWPVLEPSTWVKTASNEWIQFFKLNTKWGIKTQDIQITMKTKLKFKHPINKWVCEFNRQFSKKEILITNK